MNNFGSLRWEFEELTNKTTFLDLNIQLQHKQPHIRSFTDFHSIKFSTYQKPMNLYLYIPPHSSHPPGIINSLIHSQLRKYWFQNTNEKDFQHITTEFFRRLINRGHNPTKLTKLFHKTAATLDKTYDRHYHDNNTYTLPQPQSLPISTSSQQNNNLYFKRQFHPNDISRTNIRQSYNQTCEKATPTAPLGFKALPTDTGATMSINKLTIAYTRDRNIRDLLIPSTFRDFDKYKVSDYINRKKGDDNN